MELANDVAAYKAANNMVVFQRDREKFILDSVKANTPEKLRKSAAFLFMNIMDISKCSQINEITLRLLFTEYFIFMLLSLFIYSGRLVSA